MRTTSSDCLWGIWGLELVGVREQVLEMNLGLGAKEKNRLASSMREKLK